MELTPRSGFEIMEGNRYAWMTMRKPVIASLADYLDEHGCIAPVQGRVRRLAEFLAEVVAAVTMAYGNELPVGPLHCRRKRCRGLLQIHFDDDALICWHCPLCADEGVIIGWRNTLWDLLEVSSIRSPDGIHGMH
jgi:hypothetical protein